jgi:hypothetical protein
MNKEHETDIGTKEVDLEALNEENEGSVQDLNTIIEVKLDKIREKIDHYKNIQKNIEVNYFSADFFLRQQIKLYKDDGSFKSQTVIDFIKFSDATYNVWKLFKENLSLANQMEIVFLESQKICNFYEYKKVNSIEEHNVEAAKIKDLLGKCLSFLTAQLSIESQINLNHEKIRSFELEKANIETPRNVLHKEVLVPMLYEAVKTGEVEFHTLEHLVFI